jgi:uncharacterized protein DUF4430
MKRAAAFLISVLAVAGCGVGEGEERERGAELHITRNFGQLRLGFERVERVREGQTVMRFLRSTREIETSFGGRFVQSIDGIKSGGSGPHWDWFYFVNGIWADKGAAEFELSGGDVVHWDYRNWEAAMRIPAIVGAYPQPFKDGVEGKRFPVRVECEDAESRACKEAKRRLRRFGIPASGSALGVTGTQNVARLMVARWSRLRQLNGPALLEDGPKATGVFARFAGEPSRLELLNERGDVVRYGAPGTGLVAALRPREDELVWVATGLDDAGVEAAAQALEPGRLLDAFALAVEPRLGDTKLPVALP